MQTHSATTGRTWSIYDIALTRLSGEPEDFGAYWGQVILAVNVASNCGRTSQYVGLQALHDKYSERGFSVLGFPCNQFNGEEPGTATEIQAFCTLHYGVTFPLFAKLKVNGRRQHPLYALLTAFPHDDGNAVDVAWNFGKFLICTRWANCSVGFGTPRFRKTPR